MKTAEPMKNGISSGYVSVIMIFVVICLAALAALSFSAAGSGEELGANGRDKMREYYDADSRAKRVLMSVDAAACDAAADGFFSGFLFEDALSAMEGISFVKNGDGYRVSWSSEVSDRITIDCEIAVFSAPEQHGGKRFDIKKWNTVASESGEGAVLNVWDGTF